MKRKNLPEISPELRLGTREEAKSIYGDYFSYPSVKDKVDFAKLPVIIRSVPSLIHVVESFKGNGSFTTMPFNNLRPKSDFSFVSVEKYGEVGVLGWLARNDSSNSSVMLKVKEVQNHFIELFSNNVEMVKNRTVVVSHWTGSYDDPNHDMYEVIYSPYFKAPWHYGNSADKLWNGTGHIHKLIKDLIGPCSTIDIGQKGFYTATSYNCTDLKLMEDDKRLCAAFNHPASNEEMIIHNAGGFIFKTNGGDPNSAGLGFSFTKRNN